MIFTTDKAPYTAIEPPFDIPESWEWVRLENLFEINPRNKLDDELTVSFIPMSLIEDGYKNSHTSQIKKWKEIKSGFTHFAENDLAVAKITPCFENRKSVIFKNLKNQFGAGTTELFVFRSIGNIVNINYLFWFVKSHHFINGGVKSYSGTAGQQRVSSDYIKNCLFPLPPLNEQHRIVAKIEELLPFIEQYDKREQTLKTLNKNFPEQLKKSILQAAIQGKLTEQLPTDEPTSQLLKRIEAEKMRLISEGKLKKPRVRDNSQNEKFEPPFEIPQGWEWTKLESVILQNIGGGTPLKSVNQYWNGNISWASVKDLEKKDIYLNKTCDFISESGLKNSSSNLIPKDNIIICTRMGLGKIAINQIDVAINQDLRGIILSQEVNKLFFIYFFKTLNLQGQGLTVKGLPVDTLNNILFPLPPLEEQKRIVEKVGLLLSQIERL